MPKEQERRKSRDEPHGGVRDSAETQWNVGDKVFFPAFIPSVPPAQGQHVASCAPPLQALGTPLGSQRRHQAPAHSAPPMTTPLAGPTTPLHGPLSSHSPAHGLTPPPTRLAPPSRGARLAETLAGPAPPPSTQAPPQALRDPQSPGSQSDSHRLPLWPRPLASRPCQSSCAWADPAPYLSSPAPSPRAPPRAPAHGLTPPPTR
jgi:hypothetical protein